MLSAPPGRPWVNLFLVLITLTACAAAADATRFDSGKAFEHVRQLVAFGPRPSGSAALEQTRAYIKKELSASGVTVSEQAFDAATPIGPVRMVNVIGTIPGARKERLLITGHYDTKRFNDIRFVGASDGGSSAAFLIEMARVLKTRKNAFTIELVFFDGEEAVVEWQGTDHTYGSRHYVDAARTNGTLSRIKALILVDMIGDRNLNMYRETYSTPWLTDIIWSSARRLGYTREFQDQGTNIEDDHVAFVKAGVPSVDLIDLDYPPWHTERDTLDNVGARSLQVVADVLIDALPAIEKKLQQ